MRPIPRSIWKTEKRSHPQVQKSFWNGLLCHFPLQRPLRNQTEQNSKSGENILEWLKEKTASHKTYQPIILYCPKAIPQQLGIHKWQHVAGEVLMVQALSCFQNKEGEKNLSCLKCESVMTGKQMMHQKLLTQYFLGTTLENWMTRKNKCELMTIFLC